jgi:hypothetical protein
MAVQFGSFVALQPVGQQPSPPVHIVIGVFEHIRVQAVPRSVSTVQLIPSLQDVGQFPSQVSPASTTLFPQTALQLLSLLALQPVGQAIQTEPDVAPCGREHLRHGNRAINKLPSGPIMVLVERADRIHDHTAANIEHGMK